jgi:large subunit ribosomal protein L23
MGSFKRDRNLGYVTKGEDMKVAYVTLPREVSFTFPDLHPSDAEDKQKRREDEKSMDQSKDEFKKFLDKNKTRKGLPGWFSF